MAGPAAVGAIQQRVSVPDRKLVRSEDLADEATAVKRREAVREVTVVWCEGFLHGEEMLLPGQSRSSRHEAWLF